MTRYPSAKWLEASTSGRHGRRSHTRGIVIHNTYGSKQGDISTLTRSGQVDCHFYVAKDGDVYQFLDADSTSWTALATANNTCIHIETEGKRDVAWTFIQHHAIVKLLIWLSRTYKIQVRKVNPQGTNDGPDWRGLFDHRDLQGIDGNNHSDGVPPSFPGWERLLRDVKLGDAQYKVPPVQVRCYWFEDLFLQRQQVVLGPWRIRQFAGNAMRALSAERRRNAKVVEVDGGYEIHLGPTYKFGPWSVAADRDRTQKRREKNVGRTMRPYSTPVL